MRLIRPASLISAVLLFAVAAGCAPARRPEEQPRQTPQPITHPTTLPSTMEVNPAGQRPGHYPTPRAGSAYDDPSTGVSTIASAVPGAGAVDAVVLGNVALLGMSSQDSKVHHRVSQQVTASFPHIVEVRIATDPATIGRLRVIRQQITGQQSISPFLPELANLSTTMRAAP